MPLLWLCHAPLAWSHPLLCCLQYPGAWQQLRISSNYKTWIHDSRPQPMRSPRMITSTSESSFRLLSLSLVSSPTIRSANDHDKHEDNYEWFSIISNHQSLVRSPSLQRLWRVSRTWFLNTRLSAGMGARKSRWPFKSQSLHVAIIILTWHYNGTNM